MDIVEAGIYLVAFPTEARAYLYAVSQRERCIGNAMAVGIPRGCARILWDECFERVKGFIFTFSSVDGLGKRHCEETSRIFWEYCLAIVGCETRWL